MRALDFSPDNIAVQWQYVNRNLKDMGIWPEVEYKVREGIKGTIEAIALGEFNGKIRSKRYERNKERLDYRSGYYERSLSTTFGRIDNIKIPKAREVRVKFKVIERYQRRQAKFDEMVMLSVMLGFSTRKQAKFFKAFVGECVSHTTACKILRKVSSCISAYRNMQVGDEYEYLFLDAIWVNIKELDIKNRPILFALGMKRDGSYKIISFKLARSESEAEWTSFLNDLYRRGLEGENLQLIISDNCPGLKAAVNFVYPYTPLQLCTVHKLRNILSKIKQKKKNRKEMIKEASLIFKAEDKTKAIRRYRATIKHWQDEEPLAVKTLKRDIEQYFTYYDFAPDLRKTIKSTNPLERQLREVRGMNRRIGYFQNQRSLDIFVYLMLKERNLLIERQTKTKSEDMPVETQSQHSEELAYV